MKGHLPFQVLDASAIEGIRGLMGESLSIYSCIQIYKALTAPTLTPRDASEVKGHLPFQVLDASAIEGIRGLMGESLSIYSCIQIYKALTAPTLTPRDA